MEFRKIEIREYVLSWAMGLSETKASCPLLSFVLSIFPDFVIFLNSMERNRRHLYTRSEGFSKKRSAVFSFYSVGGLPR